MVDNPRAMRTQRIGDDLRDVRTQRTSVDPGAEVARNHMLDFVRTRERSDHTWTGDN